MTVDHVKGMTGKNKTCKIKTEQGRTGAGKDKGRMVWWCDGHFPETWKLCEVRNAVNQSQNAF